MVHCSTVCLLLCCLVGGALAEPIKYYYVRQDQGGRPATSTSVGSAAGLSNASQDPRPPAEQSPTPPEFVRLPDGRIVPYGPGIICTENEVEAFEAAAPRRLPLWFVAPPVLAGGLFCAVLCGGPPGPPRIFTSDNNPPPSDTVIPEPATLVLLGLGLAIFARRSWHRSSKEDPN